MFNVVDSIVLVLLMFGAAIGYKKGLIKSAVSFFGTLLILFLAFALKNPVSEFLFMHLPFFNFSGALAGVTVLNIIIYEVIAFLLVFSILEVLLNIVIFASGLIEKVLKLTVVLGFFSKVLGLFFGFIEYYVIIFAVLFILNNFVAVHPYIDGSAMASKILSSTPVLKNVAKDQTDAINEITSLQTVYENDKEGYNKKAFEILLKYGILDTDSATKLIDTKKLSITDAKELIDMYKEK